MQAVRVRREGSTASRATLHTLVVAAFAFVSWAALAARPAVSRPAASLSPATADLSASPVLDWRPLRTTLRTTPSHDASPLAAGEPVAVEAVADPTPEMVASDASGGSEVRGVEVLAAAMLNLGARYAWGGTSPAGFDCSGFVWYVHKQIGRPVSRVLEGQLGGGPRIPRDALQPGDAVFFVNTYMPGLSHVGIYVGGGHFIHASDERSGVKLSSLEETYWGSRYLGATRLWQDGGATTAPGETR